jgi:hypothetical protein
LKHLTSSFRCFFFKFQPLPAAFARTGAVFSGTLGLCLRTAFLLIALAAVAGMVTPKNTNAWRFYMSNRQNSWILKYVLAGHWFSESAKN